MGCIQTDVTGKCRYVSCNDCIRKVCAMKANIKKESVSSDE